MPDNVLQVGPEVFSVIAGTIVLLAAALAFAFKYDAARDKAGASGHRPEDQAKEAEIARPDGFIDSFSGVISEAGGGIPLMASIVMIATFVFWLTYLILFWRG